MSLSLKGIVRDIYNYLAENQRYEDKGLVLNVTGVANDDISKTEVITGNWANKIILFIKSSQIYDLIIYRYRSDGTTDWGTSLYTSLPATSSSYASVVIDTSNSRIGYGFKIGLQNKSGGDAANFEVYMELKN